MALGKALMTPKGSTYFWIIGTMWRDNFNKTAYISIYGFESQEHCDMTGSQPKIKLELNIYPDEYDTYFREDILKESGKSSLVEAYKAIKAKIAEFEDAQDLIFTEGV